MIPLTSRSGRRRGTAIALLGPDGAGKSTLAASLVGALGAETPVRTVYAGPYPAGQRRPSLAGAGTALVLCRLTWARARAAWHRARGRCVVFDRHPFDARLAPPSTQLRTRLRRGLISRAGHAPDVVLVLDAPAEVLFGRKGEHDIPRLEEQRRRYRAFAASHPAAVLLDTTRGADETLRLALIEIAGARVGRGRR